MKADEVIFIGAGGHALSLIEFLEDNIKGYLAKEANAEMPVAWLGDDDDASVFIEKGNKFHMAFIYSGLPLMNTRRKLLDRYEALGAEFTTLISPTAIVTPKSQIEEGSSVMAGAIINRAHLGRHVVVNSGAIVEHDCVIGDNTFIGPGAVIGGFTDIGKNCFIGLGAKVGNGLKIADNVTVAMGAVVNRNLLEPGIYHGFPLKCFKLKNQELKGL